MNFRAALTPRRMGLAIVAPVLASALAAAPVAAQTEIGHTGSVGFHSLRDSESRPGASCTWSERDGSYYWEGELTRISVRPPRVRAATGSQTVGWRFLVQRSAYYDDFGPWKTTYFSPIQWDVTDTTHDASFTRMGVNVNVPTSNPDQSPEYLYRVRVKMFWKNNAGNVIGTATHEVDWYRYNEMDSYTESYYCRGWQAWELN